MASSYTPLGVELMVTGENAGTWGTKTNNNLSLFEQLTGGFKSLSIASGATTALTIAVSRSGGWVAAVGLPTFGSSAASDLGIKLSRWAFIDHPGDQAAVVIHALTAGVDLILVGPDIKLRSDHGRKIVARMRESGASVIVVGKAAFRNFRPDIRLRVTQASWTGIELGHGRLASRKLEVERLGRGADSNLRRELVWLPDREGRLNAFDPRSESANPSGPSQRLSERLFGNFCLRIRLVPIMDLLRTER